MTTIHQTPAAAGVFHSEPAMANQLPVTPEEDEAFEALARRNDELEHDKAVLATVSDQQERKIEQLTARLHDTTWQLKNERQQRSAAIENAVSSEREKRDALSAHVEKVIQQWYSEDELFSDEWINHVGDILDDAPETSLAQRDARVAAGAVANACRLAMPGPPNPPDDPHPYYTAFCEGVASVLDAHKHLADEIAAGGKS